MKYKKQILIICLITFLFLPFQKYEEPKAELLTLTTGAIVGCVALAVACGVVIANHETFEDVGTRVWEYVSAIPNSVEQVGDKIKFNITKGLIENLVPWLVDNIPRESVYLEQTIETNGNDWYTSKTIDLNTTDSSRVALFTAYGEKSDVIQVYYKSQSASDFFSIPISITISSSNPSAYFYTRYDSNEKCVTLNANGARQHNLSKEKYKFMEFKVIGASKIVDSVCIPYGSDVDELGSVSLDKPREYFPSGTGSISVPVNYPLDSYSPSVSAPIGSLNDLVLEGSGIVVEADSVTDGVTDGVTDDTTDNVGDGTLEGDGSLDVPSVAGIDFSPLYISLSDYFPFCIPFDLYNMISDFQVSKEVPIFEVNFPEDSFIGGGTFTVDFSNYDKIVTIFRYFCLLFFVTNLIKITRRLIGNG